MEFEAFGVLRVKKKKCQDRPQKFPFLKVCIK